ncbi:hypothetical protein GCM10027291_37320 [Telluribacter humicola]
MALAAGGVLVMFRHREYRQYAAFRYIQYYLILMYTFGFYAMWSQVWFRVVFFTSDSYGTLAPVVDFLVTISTPFLIAAKLMLVLWAISLLENKRNAFFYPAGISVVLLPILLYWFYNSSQGQPIVYQLYVMLVWVVVAFISSLLLFSSIKYFDRPSKFVLVALVVVIGAIHVPVFLNIVVQPAYELIFIFLFFLSHTALGVYFGYRAQLPPVQEEVPVEAASTGLATFEVFVERYGITAREAEVVREICRGKANKEIADELFVTVQTVKDHTHRIYQKTNVKSRTQLASLLREFEN